MTYIHPAHRMSYEELISGMESGVAAGMVNARTDGSLVLFNYTPSCTFNKAWNTFTRMARGLIVDVEQRCVVATPFEKFPNYSEGMTPGMPMDPLPDEPFEVTTKMDGSLGIIFFHGGRWRVATRGSFTSEQAKWAEHYLHTKCDIRQLSENVTYLCEIVYHENRIVVSYPFEGLVLLSAYDNHGVELTRDQLITESGAFNDCLVASQTYQSVEDLLTIAKTLSSNEEGFVVRFASGRRIKIKGDEYCRIHRLVSHVTPLAVWEMLVAGDDLGAVARQLPEEFRTDFFRIETLLTEEFNQRLAAVALAVQNVAHMDDKTLGLAMVEADRNGYPRDPYRWVFPARKGKLLTEVHIGGHKTRRSFFDAFRPTANRLPGYTPSNAMNRFSEEVG